MKLRNLLLLFGCVPWALLAQDPMVYHGDTTAPTAPEIFRTPYNPKGDYQTWSIKGKVLPYFIGNAGGISTMLGLEYGFAKNQSIGIDGFLEFTEDSDDMVKDTAGVQHDKGNYYNGLERAIFLNYRYYFGFQKLRERRRIALYTVVFLRYGKIDQHYDPLYPLTKFLDNHEQHYSAGVLIGGTRLFVESRWGLDVNFGVFEKEKVISAVYLKNNVKTTTNSRQTAPGFRLSVNLTYSFYRKRGVKTSAG